MTDTTQGSLEGISGATIGSISVTGIQSITINDGRTLLQAPTADGEVYGGTPKLVNGNVSGSITFSNPVKAAAVNGLSGTFAFTAGTLGGQAARTYSITNCQFSSASSNFNKGSAASATIQFMAGTEDGTTNPVSSS